MNGVEIASSTAKWLAQRYMAWKFEVLERKALAGGLTVEELQNSDARFALYMRVGRAFEICSEREVIDFIADAMIGGIKTGDIDRIPDLPHMAISAVSGLTRTELNIILLMREHKIWGRTEKEGNEDKNYELFYRDSFERLGLNDMATSVIMNSLTKTGLVTPQASGIGAVLVVQGNRLTSLADDLFKYVDYVRRHHQ